METKIAFTPRWDAKSFHARLWGKKWWTEKEQDLGSQGKNGCSALVSGSCPLKQGKQVIYKFSDRIGSDLWRVSGVQLTFKVYDDHDKALLCLRITANIA